MAQLECSHVKSATTLSFQRKHGKRVTEISLWTNIIYSFIGQQIIVNVCRVPDFVLRVQRSGKDSPASLAAYNPVERDHSKVTAKNASETVAQRSD